MLRVSFEPSAGAGAGSLGAVSEANLACVGPAAATWNANTGNASYGTSIALRCSSVRPTGAERCVGGVSTHQSGAGAICGAAGDSASVFGLSLIHI